MVKARTSSHRNSSHRMSSLRREGPIARTIEDETSQIPSDMFLWAAGAAAGTAMLLRFMGRDQTSTFIGQWVPSILICGVYNKIVKTHGHDKADVEEFRLRRR